MSHVPIGESDRDHIPLTEATLYILLSLAVGEKHGYAILKAVPELSSSRVVLTTGTLYGALKRLLEQGWIDRVEGHMPLVTGRPQKAYTLTALGRRVLDAELRRLQHLVAIAQAQGVLGGA